MDESDQAQHRMLTKAELQRTDLGANPEDLTGIRHQRSNFSLAELLPDCTPYFYLIGAFASIFATLYISDWFWVLPNSLLFSAASLHLAYTVKRRQTGSEK